MPWIDGKLHGVEHPRLFTPPLRELTRETSHGFEAIQFAETVLGFELYPWQRWFLIHALELLPDGRPRFKTIVLMVARQNGKTALVQILTLWKMFVRGARLTLGTAQKEDLAKEIWTEALAIAQDNPYLSDQVAKVSTTNGSIQFWLRSGARYKVGAANRRGGRSLSVDGFAIIDELREQTNWDAWAAITSTVKAKATGQVIAMSNAGDAASVVLRTLREKNLEAIESGTAQSVGHFEYSAAEDCAIDDREAWAEANPSLGWNPALSEDVIAASMEVDPEDVFRIEQLCQWWTRTSSGVFPAGVWEAREDPDSEIAADSPLIMGLSAWQAQGRVGHASISIAGLRPDGNAHVELLASRDGLDWTVERAVSLYRNNDVDGLVVQARGSVASRWIDELRNEGVNVIELGGSEIGKAHGQFFQDVIAGDGAADRVFHIGQEALSFAVGEAAAKPMGGVWVFDMNNPVADIDPLVAAVEARWGLRFWLTRSSNRRSSYDDHDLLVV